MKRTHAASYACALAALALTACGTETGGAGGSLPVTGISWEARSLTVDGTTHPAPEGARMEIGTDGRIKGRNGCNSFRGDAALDKESLRVSGYEVTAMACMRGSKVFEGNFLKTLSGENGLALSDDRRTLRLTDGDDAITFAKGPVP